MTYLLVTDPKFVQWIASLSKILTSRFPSTIPYEERHPVTAWFDSVCQDFKKKTQGKVDSPSDLRIWLLGHVSYP